MPGYPAVPAHPEKTHLCDEGAGYEAIAEDPPSKAAIKATKSSAVRRRLTAVRRDATTTTRVAVEKG